MCCPKNKTEIEIMKDLGYNRIYDCGCMKFEWVKKIINKNYGKISMVK
jgi:hypothetical protein